LKYAVDPVYIPVPFAFSTLLLSKVVPI